MKVYVLTEIDPDNVGFVPANVFAFSSKEAANKRMQEMYNRRLRELNISDDEGCYFEDGKCATIGCLNGGYYLDIWERHTDIELVLETTVGELLLSNKKIFGDEEEHEINFTFFNGYAMSSSGVHMTYPKIEELNDEQIEQIIEYVGADRISDTGLMPEDVAIALGIPHKEEPIYVWRAESNDGSFLDHSDYKFPFKSERDAYDDMRNHALEKMKWNTQHDEDFGSDCDGPISYKVSFEPTKIVHESYSGIYTYVIEKGIAYRDFVLTAKKIGGGWLGFATNNNRRLEGSTNVWGTEFCALLDARRLVDNYLDD